MSTTDHQCLNKNTFISVINHQTLNRITLDMKIGLIYELKQMLI